MIVHPPRITRQVDELFLSFPLLDRKEVADARAIVAKWREFKKLISMNLKVYHKPRSNDANAYMWVLCQSIAEALHTSKEEVYRTHIRDYGEFETLVLPTNRAQCFANGWGRGLEGQQIGWFCDLIDNFDGTTTVLCYYGSSSYDTKQMSILIDSLVRECDDLGLDVQISDSIRGLLNG